MSEVVIFSIMRCGRALLAILLAAPVRPAEKSLISQEFLAAHNAVRARAGLAPLRWSEKLAAHAKDWATTLIVYSRFQHSPGLPYGENLYEIRYGTASPADVVQAWALEDRDYDYRSNRCRAGAKCGHYTQIVWRDTSTVGCGMSRSSFREVWVCEYSPPGNVVGQRPY